MQGLLFIALGEVFACIDTVVSRRACFIPGAHAAEKKTATALT